MTDITPAVNALLEARSAPTIVSKPYSIPQLDEFLKEAYNIQTRINELHSSLRSIRTAYLSTATNRTSRTRSTRNVILSDTDRTLIDTESKSVLSQLLSAVTRLSEIESVRHETHLNISLSKRAKGGISAISRWAAGGATTAASLEESDDISREETLFAHRDGVLGYLRNRLAKTSAYQFEMMEIRLRREEEKSKSLLYKSGDALPYASIADDKQEDDGRNQGLSSEQLQLFAKENQDLIKTFQVERDQLRATQQSLEEISDLQSALATSLASQSVHIDQLVTDSFATTDNVGRGNKELKRASERTSTARVLFHGTCAFCLFLVVWDLAF